MQKVTPSGSRQSTLRAIKTASSICIRSTKPPVQGQQYLDLYVLQRDRARWQQLKSRADEMIDCIDKALARLGLGSPLRSGSARPAKKNSAARRPAIVVGSRSQSQQQSVQPARGRSEKVA